jgi:nucleotide-binding universal stress UspA family protein
VSAPILVGYCPDTADEGPVNFAIAASRFSGAEIVVVAVRPSGSRLERLASGEFHGAGEESAQAALDRLRAQFEEQGVEATVRVERSSSPAAGVAAAAEALGPRLLVLGSTRRGGLRRVLPGSTAARVIEGAPCPVVVVPHGYEAPAQGVKHVGTAFAPTDEGRAALRAAAALARATGADLLAITVLNPKHAEEQSPGLLAQAHHDHDPSEERYVRERLEGEDALRAAVAEDAAGVTVETDVLFNDSVDGLVAASKRLDLLVMGSRGYGPLKAVMLGGVARRLIERSECPVVVLPRGIGAAAGDLTGQARAGAGG